MFELLYGSEFSNDVCERPCLRKKTDIIDAYDVNFSQVSKWCFSEITFQSHLGLNQGFLWVQCSIFRDFVSFSGNDDPTFSAVFLVLGPKLIIIKRMLVWSFFCINSTSQTFYLLLLQSLSLARGLFLWKVVETKIHTSFSVQKVEIGRKHNVYQLESFFQTVVFSNYMSNVDHRRDFRKIDPFLFHFKE